MLLTLSANKYVPTAARTGNGELALFRAFNGFIRGRDKTYFEVYKGSLDLSENLTAVAITGTITYSAASQTITGTGTAFLSELHRGQKLFTSARHILVVEEVVDDTHFLATMKPAGTGTTATASRMWRLFEVDKKRGSLLSGNALEFDMGTILCVGSGDLHINGATLTSNLAASRHPKIAILDPTTGNYNVQSLGFATIPGGIAAVNAAAPTAQTITASGNTLTAGAAHGLSTGSQVNITSTLTVPAPLQTNTTYFAIVTGGTTFKVASSLSDAILGLFITLSSAGTGVITETPVSKVMPAGDRSIRISKASTKLGTPSYGNPGVKIKVTLTAGQVVQITFPAMDSDASINGSSDPHDAWRIDASEFGGDTTSATANADSGPWYNIRTVTSVELGGTGAATYDLEYLDAEINGSPRLISFDNDYPQDGEFIGTVAGYPVLVSCQGKPTTAHLGGTSPGPSLVPFKVANIAAAPLILDNGSRNEVPLSPPEIIIGQYMAAGRLYLMTANTLQIAVFTADADFPVAIRPFWKSGFKNPDALCFVNGRLYGFTSAGAMRSVADGEEGSEEHAFAADVEEIMRGWDASRVSVVHDPQNECVCYVYSGNGLNTSSKYTSIILPFMLRTESWGPQITLSSTTLDMIVSGVATVNGHFEFIAGGTSQKTYRFDSYSGETVPWSVGWQFSSGGDENHPKKVKHLRVTGKVTSSNFGIHGAASGENIDVAALEAGNSGSKSGAISFSNASGIEYYPSQDFQVRDLMCFTPNIVGTWDGSDVNNLDRIDEVAIEYVVSGGRR